MRTAHDARRDWQQSFDDFQRVVGEASPGAGLSTGTGALLALVVIWWLTAEGHRALKNRGI